MRLGTKCTSTVRVADGLCCNFSNRLTASLPVTLDSLRSERVVDSEGSLAGRSLWTIQFASELWVFVQFMRNLTVFHLFEAHQNTSLGSLKVRVNRV
jgi:hypothetical protein